MLDGAQSTRVEVPPVTDTCVWDAIRYLDSPTVYREYLPVIQAPAVMKEGKFVLLDDTSVTCSKLSVISALALLGCTAVFWWLRS